jgi:putative cell wall-binding protein
MGSCARRVVSVATVVAVALALSPAAAVGRPASRSAPSARRAKPLAVHAASLSPQGVSTYAEDRWDSADDTATGAQNLTEYVSGHPGLNGFGRASYDETHTFYVASDETPAGPAKGDQDWFRSDVTSSDVSVGKPYLIEAKSLDANVDPVIEVYGPTTTSTVAASDPASLPLSLEGVGLTDPAAVAANDTGPWSRVLGQWSASASFVATRSGSYFFRVRPEYAEFRDDTGTVVQRGYLEGAGRYVLRFKVGQVTRLSGDDRVKTAVAISKERYADKELPELDLTGAGGTVVVSTGWNFADALAGSTLAGAVSAPILLTHQYKLDPEVRAEIIRLGAHRVFLLGGKTSVNNDVRDALVKLPGFRFSNVIRVSGDTRVETAIEIAKRASDEYGLPHTAFITNAWSFPDALAASPMAALNVVPILLTTKDSLSPATAKALTDLDVTDVVILGSAGAVGTGVEKSLKAQLNKDGKAHVLRLGGADRYETAKKIAVWSTGNFASDLSSPTVGTGATKELYPLDWSGIGVAAGWNYPDALGGGPMAGLSGHPLLLAPKGTMSPWLLNLTDKPMASYLSTDPAKPNYVGKLGRSFIFGGSRVVSDGVLLTLDSLAWLP